MERWIKRYRKRRNFTIEPWDSRYYALFEGEKLVCVTVYKVGALEVMKRLAKVRKCQDCPLREKGRRDRKDKVMVKKGR
jgi:hypothetical protein